MGGTQAGGARRPVNWRWERWAVVKEPRRGREERARLTLLFHPLHPTEGFRGWEVEHGGNGWAVEKNLTLVPGAPSQTCFVTSFE